MTKRLAAAVVAAAALLVSIGACVQPELQIPEVGFECVRVPLAKCHEIRDDQVRAGRGAALRGISIRCTSAQCTPAQGEAEVRITRADGTAEVSGVGWSTLAPAPVMPSG